MALPLRFDGRVVLVTGAGGGEHEKAGGRVPETPFFGPGKRAQRLCGPGVGAAGGREGAGGERLFRGAESAEEGEVGLASPEGKPRAPSHTSAARFAAGLAGGERLGWAVGWKFSSSSSVLRL